MCNVRTLSDTSEYYNHPMGVAVVADSEEVCDRALRLVKIEWEERPFILDMEEAAKPNAIKTMPEVKRTNEKAKEPNTIMAEEVTYGDMEKGFAEADVVLEETFTTSVQLHAALEAHFQRTGTRADIEQGYAPGTRHIVYHHDRQPLVTIVIPNRDSYGFLKPCINSLFEKTDYPAFEVIVVDNQSADPDVLAYYHEASERYAGRFRVIAYDHPFNFSAQCNLGVDQAAGEYILLLNNDTEIVQPAWLTRMMQFGQRPDVGIVGARLVYPENGGIQHAGVIVGLDRLAAHPYQGYTLENPGYMNRLHVDQDYSAVTAACMLIRRALYQEVGGMDADNLQALYNDIDLCLKTGAAGYRIVWTPHATVVHLEHKSLDKESRQQYEARDSKAGNYMHSRWQKELANDPAYNRHLSLSARDFSVAQFPRPSALADPIGG